MQLWNFKIKAIIFKRKGLYFIYKPFFVILTVWRNDVATLYNSIIFL